MHQLHQPLHIAQHGIREMVLKPVGLSNKITRLAQHFDGPRPRLVQRLVRPADVSIDPESEFRAARSFTPISTTRPASFAARSICLVRSRQRSASGCRAARAACSPALFRCAFSQCRACAAASASNALVSAASVVVDRSVHPMARPEDHCRVRSWRRARANRPTCRGCPHRHRVSAAPICPTAPLRRDRT